MSAKKRREHREEVAEQKRSQAPTNRGEVWWIWNSQVGWPKDPNEEGKGSYRPALVLRDTSLPKGDEDILLIAPFSTHPLPDEYSYYIDPSEHPNLSLQREGCIVLSFIQPIRREHLHEYAGHLNPDSLEEIAEKILALMGLIELS
jgi:mRNA-degrading endonuclease toxin of MazEF toxin-antitoxin module